MGSSESRTITTATAAVRTISWPRLSLMRVGMIAFPGIGAGGMPSKRHPAALPAQPPNRSWNFALSASVLATIALVSNGITLTFTPSGSHSGRPTEARAGR